MENQYKNEMEITLGGEKILLRPTFENMAALETALGSIPFLMWKFGKGYDPVKGVIDPELAAKSLPGFAECTQIIYTNQAEKKFTRDQIFEMVCNVGISIAPQMVVYISKSASGNKMAAEPTKRQKKKLSELAPTETINWPSLMTFCVVRLQMRPKDFWGLTFGEFWPLYNQATGNIVKPLSADELDELEASWTGANNGNT